MTNAEKSYLRPEELEWIESARDWVKGHFSVDPDQNYEPINGKLSVIGTILAHNWVASNETWKLQALGIAFGDALSQKLSLDWVTVDDEYGCDPALHWPDTSIYCYPLTMISKRLEAGERVDILSLFNAVCDDLGQMARSGHYT